MAPKVRFYPHISPKFFILLTIIHETHTSFISWILEDIYLFRSLLVTYPLNLARFSFAYSILIIINYQPLSIHPPLQFPHITNNNISNSNKQQQTATNSNKQQQTATSTTTNSSINNNEIPNQYEILYTPFFNGCSSFFQQSSFFNWHS